MLGSIWFLAASESFVRRISSAWEILSPTSVYPGLGSLELNLVTSLGLCLESRLVQKEGPALQILLG